MMWISRSTTEGVPPTLPFVPCKHTGLAFDFLVQNWQWREGQCHPSCLPSTTIFLSTGHRNTLAAPTTILLNLERETKRKRKKNWETIARQKLKWDSGDQKRRNDFLLVVQRQCWYVKVLLCMYFPGSRVFNHKVLVDLLSKEDWLDSWKSQASCTAFQELAGMVPSRGVFWSLQRRGRLRFREEQSCEQNWVS